MIIWIDFTKMIFWQIFNILITLNWHDRQPHSLRKHSYTMWCDVLITRRALALSVRCHGEMCIWIMSFSQSNVNIMQWPLTQKMWKQQQSIIKGQLKYKLLRKYFSEKCKCVQILFWFLFFIALYYDILYAIF